MKRQVLVPLSFLLAWSCSHQSQFSQRKADFIVRDAKVFRFGAPNAQAFAVSDGKFLMVGSNDEVLRLQGPHTKVISAQGRRTIPGLIDTHHHPIRAGLNYNLELSWEGVTSLKEALKLLKEQSDRTPEGQWVRVVGGWTPYQFQERRFPTIDELNEASPNRPVFVLYLYSKGFLNQAALKELKYDRNTKFPQGEVVLDKQLNPTGLLLAKPSAFILYKTLISAPKLGTLEEELNSTLLYFRKLSQYGLTSVLDAGGGGFYYPQDHRIAMNLNERNDLPIRIPFFLFAPNAKKELEDYQRWTKMISPPSLELLDHSLPYFLVGGGENLVNSAGDFENFMEPRPELTAEMESELKPVLKHLFSKNWMFRIHATYDESISRILNVLEEIKAEKGAFPDRFIIDHAETVSEKNLRRIHSLGGGISIQGRMAFAGEDFVKRYGKEQALHAPPIGLIKSLKIPLGSGTDATRVASPNPWVAIYWMVSGKTLGGLKHLSPENQLSREDALFAMTKGAAWFSREENLKGNIAPGEYADFTILDKDYFHVSEESIKSLKSVLTVKDGRITHGSEEFTDLAPAIPRALPEWSPVNLRKQTLK